MTVVKIKKRNEQKSEPTKENFSFKIIKTV